MSLLTKTKEWVVVLIGMSGFRIDRYREGARFVLTAIGWTAFLAANYLVFDRNILGLELEARRDLALTYVLAIWVIYYFGNSAVLGFEPIRQWMIRNWGEDQAYKRYESVIGVVYLAQGLCQSALVMAYAGTFPQTIPVWLTYGLGVALVMTGTVGKAWATYLTGLDKYYYRDMFLGRDEAFERKEPFVVAGPYRYFSNPMYGIGYLSGYGLALIYRSWEYLICAAAFQASIYAFYFLFEKASIKRIYFTPAVAKTDETIATEETPVQPAAPAPFSRAPEATV